MTAQGVKLGVVLNPSFISESIIYGLLQAIDGFFGSAKQSKVAAHVIEHARVFRICCKGPLGPL